MVGAGTSGSPYQITTWAELDDLRNHLDSYFILMNNLSSSTTGYSTYASSSANAGAGWIQLGQLTGNFNGQGFTVSDLYINSSATNTYCVGLFGIIIGTVKNLGVINANVTWSGYFSGQAYTGALAGYASLNSTIENCFSTGSVTGSYSNGYAGGLLGGVMYTSTIQNCYSSCSVNGHMGAGGFVGYVQAGYITNCYSIGSVTSAHTAKGFMGYINSSTYNAVGCFWDTQTSGQATSAGAAIGKTTSQMKTLATFTDVNWSIANKSSWTNEAWYIDEGTDYPRLGWQYLPVFANIKTINGVPISQIKAINGVPIANIKSWNGLT